MGYTPYITGLELQNESTGINWGLVFPGGSGAIDAGCDSLVRDASDIIDNECGSLIFTASKNYVLRATQNTETASTSDRIRAMVDDNNNLCFITTFRPIRSIISMSYQVIPGNGLGTQNITVIDPTNIYFENREVYALGFWTGAIAAPSGYWGFSYWAGYSQIPLRVSVTYINGFPNTQLTDNVSSGATSIIVDDPTGIMPGDTMTIYDIVNGREIFEVDASYTSGTTIPLNSGTELSYNHPSGTRVSELDGNAKQATIYMVYYLLSMRSQQGVGVAREILHKGAVPGDQIDYYAEALSLLDNYILTP